MKIIITKLFLVLTTLLSCVATTQAQVPLLCKGEIETTTDAIPVKKPIVIDVLLSLEDSTLEINGYWGCLADIGTDNPFGYKCFGKMPVVISDAEIKFAARSSNDKYEGFTDLAINRYSGSLTVSSHATSKPAANAKWLLMMISAKLQCTRPEKKF